MINEKPAPYEKTTTLMDLMDMIHWIDEKYNIKQRDYAGHFAKGPKWNEVCAANGVSLERANELYRTSPVEVTDPVEKAAMEAARLAVKTHRDSVPYQDFWHFQLTCFHDFGNDRECYLPLKYMLEAAEEDWQKEIAQMWVAEYGEYADEDGGIKVWVCW